MREHKLLNKLERKFGNFGIPNLMTLIVFGMSIVFVLDTFINPDYDYDFTSLIHFSKADIMKGQVWRVITFVFEPPPASLLFVVFVLYLYWMIGSALEANWGTFRFNVYYLVGVLGTIVTGLITGYATNYYLNMSLFLAFAMLYPNMEMRLFFLIPIKLKYLALLDSIFLLAAFVMSGWYVKLLLLVSFINFLLFFGLDLLDATSRFFRRLFNKFKKRSPGNHRNHNQNNNNGNWNNHWWDDQNNNPFK